MMLQDQQNLQGELILHAESKDVQSHHWEILFVVNASSFAETWGVFGVFVLKADVKHFKVIIVKFLLTFPKSSLKNSLYDTLIPMMNL